jgi:hypothetical protein
MIGKILRILALLVCSFIIFACQYIVVPDDIVIPGEESDTGTWKVFATNVSTSGEGNLRIDITILNNTSEWSKLQSLPEIPAVLTSNDGTNTNCDTVFVGTGGHRLAPGFQMRGYTAEMDGKPQTQLLYVECKNTSAAPGSKLTIKYASYGGILDDYDPEANKTEGVLELNLDEVSTDLTYPLGSPVEGLILPSDTGITGLSENVVTLLDVQHIEGGLEFTWQNFNPTKFALKTHIGIPPVIGEDGIIYGVYETLDMPSVPITPAKEHIEWTTTVDVPQDVDGLYILLSVESKKPRTYLNYVLDITSK